MTIDETDKKILVLLQKDASLTVKEIAQQVNLSTTPCWKRVQRLEQLGVIKSKVAILAPELVGNHNIVFIMIKTADYGRQWGEIFAKEISAIDDVLEVYRLSGETDYILKGVIEDIGQYDQLVQKIVDKVQVREISSMFAIEQIKYSTALPL